MLLAPQRRVRAGCGASLERSPRCGDSPALLGLAARRRTRYALARFARTAAASQSTSALRAWPQALCCSASQRRAAAGPHPPLQRGWRRSRAGTPTPWLATGGPRWGRSLWRRGAQIRGRRAQRASFLARRGCSNGVRKAHAVSSAARPRIEHRSAVEAKRRPPQCEPPPATPCREASEREQQ